MGVRLVQVAVVAAMVVGGGTAMAAGKRTIPSARPVTGVVNLNTGTPKELALLPGIGPKRAALIVAWREKQPFKSPAEVVKVKGVGKATYARIKDHLSVSGPTTLAVVANGKKAAPAGDEGGAAEPAGGGARAGMKTLQ